MFTNWLTSSSSGVTAPPNLLATPPDIILEVGPSHSTRFMAHSTLLAMHSGYLRSAMHLDENGVSNPDVPIYLSNVTPDQFAPLFTYMYTGYLDLNIENIFGVLLATHVLHMPRALEICRAFLSQTQSEGYVTSGFLAQLTGIGVGDKTLHSGNVKVIRPIASKPALPNIGFIVPPMPHISLPSTDTNFRSLNSQPDSQNLQAKRKSRSPSERTCEASNHSNSPVTANDNESNKCSKAKNLLLAEHPKKLNDSEDVSLVRRESDSKTIVDIANCDGPVRFQRVLNDAYGQHLQPENCISDTRKSQKSVSISFQQQMAKNIQKQQSNEESEFENSETKSQKSPNEVFNCIYCKHTFKSQYCYQKHAKRHLNPLSLDIAFKALSKKDKVLAKQKDVKREVRPLDMNVQYYPCKTCGSKFPSYYFVHKHRKMCHPNEENSQ